MSKELKNNNNRKRNFHIDSGSSTDKIFASSEIVQSDNEDGIDKLTNHSDMEFIAPEEIELQVFWNQKEISMLLTKGQHNQRTRDKQKEEKAGRKYPNHMETQRFSIFSRDLFSWGWIFLPLWPKCFSFWYLWTSYQSWCFDWFTCSTKQPLFATKQGERSYQYQGNESFHWCQLNHGCKTTVKHTNVLGLQSFHR